LQAQEMIDETCVGVSLGGFQEEHVNYEHVPALFSCHAGETLEPNTHIRESLAIGADRIGHGLNLFTDPTTMYRMTKPIEACMISNKFLGHIEDYKQYPLAQYIRNDIPIVLCTDNPGYQASTLTDEYFIAVTEHDLSWYEVEQLTYNSLQHSFADQATKQELLLQHSKLLNSFKASRS